MSFYKSDYGDKRDGHAVLFVRAAAAFAAVCAVMTFFSCVSARHVHEPCSRNLSTPGIKNARQLTEFFLSSNPDADRQDVLRLAKLYISESAQEEINSDAAFVQMCLETGFLRFGNLVTPAMHNYCGLGSIDAGHPGESFATEQLGVRAHIQHLHAYATTEDKVLKNECIDKRYRYVKPRGKAPDIFALAGTWAMDKTYGQKLDALLTRLEDY